MVFFIIGNFLEKLAGGCVRGHPRMSFILIYGLKFSYEVFPKHFKQGCLVLVPITNGSFLGQTCSPLVYYLHYYMKPPSGGLLYSRAALGLGLRNAPPAVQTYTMLPGWTLEVMTISPSRSLWSLS